MSLCTIFRNTDFIDQKYQKNSSQKDFLTTVYSKLCSILQNSASVQRYKVVIAALEVVKERAALFQERLLLESPDKIYAALLNLCAHSNREVKYPALVSFFFSFSLSLSAVAAAADVVCSSEQGCAKYCAY